VDLVAFSHPPILYITMQPTISQPQTPEKITSNIDDYIFELLQTSVPLTLIEIQSGMGSQGISIELADLGIRIDELALDGLIEYVDSPDVFSYRLCDRLNR
jgi:hypothetical protein